MKILKAEARLPCATLELVEKIYKDEARPLWIKVNILRNKAFGHRSVAHTVEEVFRDAEVTPNELRDLVEATEKLLNELTYAWDKSVHAFNLGSLFGIAYNLLEETEKRIKATESRIRAVCHQDELCGCWIVSQELGTYLQSLFVMR